MVMMFGVLEKKIKLSDLAKNWVLISLFNIVGGVLVAWFFGYALGLTEGNFAAKTIAAGSGSPVMGSVWDGGVIFSLLGDPHASLVDFHVFYWHLLAHFLGFAQFLPEGRHARLGQDFRRRGTSPASSEPCLPMTWSAFRRRTATCPTASTTVSSSSPR
ncbi:formate/nitrite transporter family protein [Thermophilibacter immobilis]|jgi:hypothetical protein|uniref:Formate/nitrite transporter family protein n=1 Tax=Thermophilibacter immobilis TaxID=2779519 RepID=A0A7S7M7B7_9ACTN|nr:formate/nitrite transporter family protein [Thermophilibacter immobilis]QOY60084.1 formate/nitrite transporter family protein [Thermophilibacter immobilis]